MKRLLPTLLTVLSLLAAGCGDGGATLSGTVTIDGQPLKRGSVRLDPEDGKGTPVGGLVQDGKYELKGVPPGKYKLHVEGEAATSGPTSQEEVMKRSEKEHEAATKNPVPPGATGNDQVVTVTKGSQKQDVKLESPARK